LRLATSVLAFRYFLRQTGKQRRNAISLSSADAKQLRDQLTPSENEVIENTPEEERSDGASDGADDDEEGDGDGE